MIEYLYNTCYGGFSFSKEFEEEFLRRHPEKKELILKYYETTKRYDKDIVALWKEMGNKANGSYSKIKSKLVPEKFIDFVEIDEYDGMESIGVNWQAIYAKICHDLVTAIKNNEDTSTLIQEYDEAYAQRHPNK